MVIVYGDKINDFIPLRFTNIHIRNNLSSTQVRKYALVIARFRERYTNIFRVSHILLTYFTSL